MASIFHICTKFQLTYLMFTVIYSLTISGKFYDNRVRTLYWHVFESYLVVTDRSNNK